MWGMAPKPIPVSNPEVLARTIERRRAELGLTQEQLAAASGLGLATISNLESGRQPAFSRRTLDRVGRALEWPDGWMSLIDEDDYPALELLSHHPRRERGDSSPPDEPTTGEVLQVIRQEFAALTELLGEVLERIRDQPPRQN